MGASMQLRVAHLYPRLMNIYGDRGNVLCLVRRCRERGIDVHVTPLGPGDTRPPGMLIDGCFNQPKRVANDSELLWGDAYLLMALYYLETGRAPA